MGSNTLTARPWQRITSAKHPGAVFIKGRGRDNFVCKVYANAHTEANTRLIEHAPDTASALQTLLAAVQGLPTFARAEVREKAVEAAQAALTAATGRPPLPMGVLEAEAQDPPRRP